MAIKNYMEDVVKEILRDLRKPSASTASASAAGTISSPWRSAA